MRRAPHLRGVTGGAAAALLLLAALWATLLPGRASAQTPSPLQEWQYSGGVVLYKLFKPDTPDWRVELGLAAEPRPLYEGAGTYRVLGGPVIDIRYQDLAFASVGEGLGINFLHGDHYRMGMALGYDMGRHESVDLTHLRGLGDVAAAPVLKLFGSYVISKEFPLVLRADVRRFLGGADGVAGDVEAYLPLPGSSEKLAMFAGPSVTFADRQHLQTLFGVDAGQSLASGYPVFSAHGGANAAGFGFSITRILSTRWLINADFAVERLLGSAGDSPVTQTRLQNVAVLSAAYHW